MNMLDMAPNKDLMWYLASPYADVDITLRVVRASTALTLSCKLLDAGHNVFSPIVYSLPIREIQPLHVGFSKWKKFDLAMIKACGQLMVLMLPGWKDSVGVSEEIKFAEQNGCRVLYLDEDLNIM